jgi:hypothetical protein
MTRMAFTDTSFWQKEIDYLMMHAAGAEATILRGGSADKFTLVPYTDFRFEENAPKAIWEMAASVYWYLRLAGKIVEQMEYFAELWGAYPFHFEPVLDVEDVWYSNGNVIPKATCLANLKLAVDTLKNLTGYYAILYSRTSLFKPYIGTAAWMSNHKLWISRYPFTSYHPDVLTLCQTMQPGVLPQPWEEIEGEDTDDIWWGWQCSADENQLGATYGVQSAAIDLNLTKVEKSVFYAGLLRPFVPGIPPGGDPVIPAPVVFARVIDKGTYEWINLRDFHAITGTDVGDVPVNTVFPVFAEWKKTVGYNGKPEHWVITRHPLTDEAGWVAMEWNGSMLCEWV